MKDSIILIGGGGHCRACIDVIEREGRFTIAGIVDVPEKKQHNVLGYPVIGSDADLSELIKTFPNVLITLGHIKSPNRRMGLFNDLMQIGARLPMIQSPLSYISPHAHVAEGTIVMHHALINAGATVGRNCIVNTKALVEHDAVIEDHCHISTGAIVNGGVTIGSGSFFGSGAVSKDNTSIPANSFIKANSLCPKTMNKTFIIAEAGVNHNGSLEMALQLIDVAVAAGADAVKFQTFKAEKVIAANAPKACYQKETTGSGESQLEMVIKLELDEAAHIRLHQYCRQKGIQFLSTPFDLESIDLLRRLGLEIFKIPSGEITNLPYLRKLGALKKRLILSTGMSNLCEIEAALDVLTESGTPLENIIVLHCNTEYPTPFEDVNLRAMLTIRNAFPGLSVGYSDHTNGIEAPIAAVAMGASVIEKHFTLDRNLHGPDHRASLEPHELTAMISGIRNIEKALGTGIKKPSPSELKNKPVVRKSIVAAKVITKGQLFDENNLGVKRVGQSGINPMRWNELIGKQADRNYVADEVIEL